MEIFGDYCEIDIQGNFNINMPFHNLCLIAIVNWLKDLMMEIILPSLCDMFENQRINGVKQIFISGIKKLIPSWCHNFLNKGLSCLQDIF